MGNTEDDGDWERPEVVDKVEGISLSWSSFRRFLLFVEDFLFDWSVYILKNLVNVRFSKTKKKKQKIVAYLLKVHPV